MSTSTSWNWSADPVADPVAERAAIKAWNDAANEGGMPGYCDAVARAAVVKHINDRADKMEVAGRPAATAPPVVLLRGRFTMRDVKAKLRAYETLYGVKATIAVAGR